MESPSTESTEPASAASPSSAADQARIRRERRQAKLKNGSIRLNKITSTQSNSKLYETAAADAELSATDTSTSQPTNTASPAPTKAESHAQDPPDIDISEHYYKPTGTPRPTQRSNISTSSLFSTDDSLSGPPEADLAALMAQYGGGGMGELGGPNSGVGGGLGTGAGAGGDPMMMLMQQLMGMPPVEGAAGPELQQQQHQPYEDKWGMWWRVLHTICSLILAAVALNGPHWGAGYDGSLEDRESRRVRTAGSSKFFYYFATMELVLQSTRFIVEKGRPPPGSMLSMIGQALPPPFGMYFLTAARYSVIWTNIVNDALLIIFVLGMAAWWHS